MASGSKPRPIKGTPGSRIRVILGKTGSEYVLVMNEDDGASVWQTVDWSLASGIPDKIPRQINNCVNKERYVKELDFNTTTGAWYVNGVRRDGTGGHSWWGSTEASETIQEAVQAGEGKVSFGSMRNDYIYEEEETYAVIVGRNGFTLSSNLDKGLKERISRMNRLNKEIKFVRLFDDGGYFISDDEGTQWDWLGEHALKELKHGRGGAVNDVALAGDGSWIVIRDHHFVSSKGVSQKLERKLTSFYSEQKSRNEARQREINEFVSRVQQAEQERLAREAAERESARREAREEQERLAREAAERERAEAQERERLAREAAERERAEKQERERLTQKLVSELQEECKEIQVLENLINKRKREVLSSLESLPPSRRARIEVVSIWKSSASSSKAECVICHDGEAERALIPCGHHCLCDDCSEQLMNAAQRCPLCREPVQSTLKIYGQS